MESGKKEKNKSKNGVYDGPAKRKLSLIEKNIVTWLSHCSFLRIMLKSQKAVIIDGGMNSEWQQQILKETVRMSDCELNLSRKWVMQLDNYHEHISQSAKEWLKKGKVHVLERSSQSLDLNLTEILWTGLKRAVHQSKPMNISELNEQNLLQSEVSEVQDWSTHTWNFVL